MPNTADDLLAVCSVIIPKLDTAQTDKSLTTTSRVLALRAEIALRELDIQLKLEKLCKSL